MKVLLFGIAREIVGERFVNIEPNDKLSTVSELKNWMKETYPGFNKISSFAIAVDNEFSTDDTALSDEQEIAIIPPVSGG